MNLQNLLSLHLPRQWRHEDSETSVHFASFYLFMCSKIFIDRSLVFVSLIKAGVMFLLEWKIVVCLTNSSLLPHITTSMVHQETPGFTSDVLAGLEGHGMLNEMTNASGSRLTLEGLLVCHELPLKVDRMLTSGSQVTMCPIVSRDSGLWPIRSTEGQRLVSVLVMSIKKVLALVPQRANPSYFA